jgi:hypothetical protein
MQETLARAQETLARGQEALSCGKETQVNEGVDPGQGRTGFSFHLAHSFSASCNVDKDGVGLAGSYGRDWGDTG